MLDIESRDSFEMSADRNFLEPEILDLHSLGRFRI